MKKNYNILYEGLVVGDLEDLIIPFISIDEYESKISDDNIVIAFFAKDKEPAKDLSRFLAKSEIDILDSEVSPVPNKNGYYLVFVEINRDTDFIENIINLVESTEALVGVLTWKYKAYKRKIKIFKKENLEQDIRLTPKNKKENLKTSLKDSVNIQIIDNKLKAGNLWFNVKDIGNENTIVEKHNLNKQAILLDESSLSTNTLVSKSFGPNWQVDVFANGITATNLNSKQTILLTNNK